MDPRVPALPIFLIGVLIMLFDPILGLIFLLIGLIVYLSAMDPSHAQLALYFFAPMILFLIFVRFFRDSVPLNMRPIIITLAFLASLAIAAIFGSDFNGLIFAPMFFVPIAIALIYDPSGYLAVIAAVLSYVPYALIVAYYVRSVGDVKEHPMIGKIGIAITDISLDGGIIKIGNTYRDAISKYPIRPGMKVAVVGVEGIKLIVVPYSLYVSRHSSRQSQKAPGGVLSRLFSQRSSEEL